MKKMLFILLCIPFLAGAQLPGIPGLSGKNIFKTNLSSLAFKNYNFTYERKIHGRLSVSLGYRFMPNGKAPFISSVKDLIESDVVNFDNLRMGGNALTPEVRIYVGKGNLTGLYVAPYLRFSKFDVSIPVKYESNTINGVTVPTFKKEADASGSIKSTSGGVMLGMQKRLFKVLVLDLWIIGGHVGTSKGDIAIKTSLEPNFERPSMDQALAKLTGKTKPFDLTASPATATGATLKVSGPWYGVRGLGINVGIRF